MSGPGCSACIAESGIHRVVIVISLLQVLQSRVFTVDEVVTFLCARHRLLFDTVSRQIQTNTDYNAHRDALARTRATDDHETED